MPMQTYSPPPGGFEERRFSFVTGTKVAETAPRFRAGVLSGSGTRGSRFVPRRLLFALFPVLLTGLLLPAFLILYGPSAAWEGMRLSLLSCISSGKLVVLEAGSLGSFEPFAIAAAVFYVDLCLAFPLAYNLEVLYRLPGAGDLLRALEKRSKAILHHSTGKKAFTYGGLFFFVAIPLGGTGAVGGAFFGRLLGLSRSRTLSGIVAGSLAGNLALAAGAYLWPVGLQKLLERPVFGALGALVALVVVGILLVRLRSIPRL